MRLTKQSSEILFHAAAILMLAFCFWVVMQF